MKIKSLKLNNYRTLEDVQFDFDSSYTAICGANDSGKTNVVRAIRALMKEEDPYFFRTNQDELSFNSDYPKWKETDPADRTISQLVVLELDQQRDAGFYEFVRKILSIEDSPPTLEFSIRTTLTADSPAPNVVVSFSGKDFEGLEAQEVLNKLQSSRSILFHNSTQVAPMHFGRAEVGRYLRGFEPDHDVVIESMKKKMDKAFAKIAKNQQQELEELLGRLETKYKVTLSVSTFNFDFLPYSLTLGQKKFDVPLDDWGSGTKNRTMILLALFQARKISAAESSASKITPIIIIEEPESFLHPSAQAEFGRILQDLSKEFDVQVIVTTHSPYLLNSRQPTSNLLLCRKVSYNQMRETERVLTADENWMEPFCQALGLESEEFKPWKELITSSSDAILLVEGKTDREYFEMLRDPAHGSSALDFDGDIVSYDGTGSLSNTVLLRFVRNRYEKIFITYDLDAEKGVTKSLSALGLVRKKDHMPVGRDAPGKRNIEGLLPTSVTEAVYSENAELVQAATAGDKHEQNSAKGKLKKLMLEKFRESSKPGGEYFGLFYPLTKLINKAIG